MDNLVDNGKSTKCIKIFDKIFFIESEPKMNASKHVGWKVKVTYRPDIKDKRNMQDITESYIDYVDDRHLAEQACLGYMLIEHCQGGIFWKECNFPELK